MQPPELVDVEPSRARWRLVSPSSPVSAVESRRPTSWKLCLREKEHFCWRGAREGRRGDRGRPSRRCLHSPATPGAAVQDSAEAPGEAEEQSGGDAMEVCSDRAAPCPEPVGQRRASSHRSAPGVSPQQAPRLCFMTVVLGLGRVRTGERTLGRRCSCGPGDVLP